MTTPPNDPTQPGEYPPYGLPPYGSPQEPTSPPSSPHQQYEGATDGFGGPFIPTPEQLAPPAYTPPQAPPPAQFPPYQSPYGAPSAPPPGQPTAPPYGAPYGQPYGQQPYGPPQPYGMVQGQPHYPGPATGRNGMAVAGMVLGIVSIPLALLSFFDIPVVIVGLVLSIVGLNRAKRSGIGKTMATWGIVLSLVGALACTAMTVYVVRELSSCSRVADIGSSEFEDCVQDRT